MNIDNEIINNYIESIDSRYNEDVFKKILEQSYNKELAEKSAINFYTKKNNGIEPLISWVNNPLELRDLCLGKNVNIYSSYSNINWIYFYLTFKNHLSDSGIKINSLYHKDKKDLYVDCESVFNIFSNVFGVCEISGDDVKYKEIVLIKKPNNVKTLNGKLHSIKGSAFDYNNKLKFYFIDGIEFTENLWVRMIKTSLSNSKSIVNDQLTDSEKRHLKTYINEVEKTIGKQDKLSVEDMLSINNLEIKSRVIRYVGYNKIMEIAKLRGEESVTTHKGEIVNYQLFDIDLGLEIDRIPSRFVKVVCWSTGKEYILQVDPRNKQCQTPLGAIAWTCLKPDGTHCTEEEYLHLEQQT
jgi:hypothetical protein